MMKEDSDEEEFKEVEDEANIVVEDGQLPDEESGTDEPEKVEEFKLQTAQTMNKIIKEKVLDTEISNKVKDENKN